MVLTHPATCHLTRRMFFQTDDPRSWSLVQTPFMVKRMPVNGCEAKQTEQFVSGRFEDGLANNIFIHAEDDDRPRLSVEDRKFVNIMESNMEKNDAGNWVAPLPFRHEIKRLPESHNEAYKRLKSTQKTLDKKPLMKQHYFAFMKDLLDKGNAEPVPLQNIASSKMDSLVDSNRMKLT